MPNLLSILKGDYLPRRARAVHTTEQRVDERKLYFYPDYLNPSMATDPDVYAAIRLGTLVHGPGATDMIYKAWHYDDWNSAIFACLSAIATAYPEAQAKVYLDRQSDERRELPDHPLKLLLDNPNPHLSRENMWHWTQWCKHISGNAYWRKVRAGNGRTGNVVQLWPISPSRMLPVTTKEDADAGIFISYYAYTYDPAKPPERVPPEDIIHFRLGLDDRDHRLGASPLARVVQEIAGDDEAHKWQATMLENGGAVGMMIQVPKEATITAEQAEEMKRQFEQRFGGSNRGRTGVLTGGATANPYGFSPEQMDMKSLHRLPEERISAVLRVPAIIAGLGAGLDRSTYANFREAREMFAEMTMLPLYSFDAATLNRQLLPEFTSDRTIKVDFDINALRAFAEDEDAKWKRLDAAVKTGWVRPDEARTAVGLKPNLGELPSQAAPLPPGDGQDDEDDDMQAEDQDDKRLPAPRRRKAVRRPHVPSQDEMNKLPEFFQALVEAAEPGTERDLEKYFAKQHRRVRREVITS